MYIHKKIGVWTTPIFIAKGFWLQRWSVEFFNGMQVCHCSRKDLDCLQEFKYGSTVWTRWLNAINRNHHLVQHLLNTNYTPDTEPEAQNSTVIEKEKTRGKKSKKGFSAEKRNFIDSDHPKAWRDWSCILTSSSSFPSLIHN